MGIASNVVEGRNCMEVYIYIYILYMYIHKEEKKVGKTEQFEIVKIFKC